MKHNCAMTTDDETEGRPDGVEGWMEGSALSAVGASGLLRMATERFGIPDPDQLLGLTGALDALTPHRQSLTALADPTAAFRSSIQQMLHTNDIVASHRLGGLASVLTDTPGLGIRDMSEPLGTC